MTEQTNRYAPAYVSMSKTAATTAKSLQETYILYLGFPEKIINDHGRNFASYLIKDLYRMAGIQKLRITPYHIQIPNQ